MNWTKRYDEKKWETVIGYYKMFWAIKIKFKKTRVRIILL